MVIEAEGVSKHYKGTHAVNGISFGVAEGETLVLLGTSGCGKTTTLKMINRLIAPTGGTIKVNGADIMQQQPETLRRGIGYVLQHNSLFPHYTIAQNIATVPQLLGWDKAKIKARVATLMEKLKLSPEKYADAYPHQLSGGQQQRVNIARALAADPPILLMDEPFAALDTITRVGIRKEFAGLDELKRKTIVMVTHDVQEAFEMGDKVCLMKDGGIVQIGTPASLLFSPADDFVKQFLSSSYLQLAASVVNVKDVWAQLSITQIPVAAPFTAESSLWQVMEYLVQHGLQAVAISDNGDIRQVEQEKVLGYINLYKRTKYN